MDRASVFISDWNNPELDKNRPNQLQVSEVLLPEIYQCLHLLWTLSNATLSACFPSKQLVVSNLTLTEKRLSDESIKVVNAHRDRLAVLLKRMESNQLLDTQVTVFKVSDQVTDLRECR